MNWLLNKQHLKKELRPLLPPWSMAVFAGSLLGLRPLVEGSGGEGLLLGLAAYGFLGGLTLLATNAFGLELHERTFPLLLSQPFSRSRLWGQKMLVVSVAILAAVAAETALLTCLAGWYPGSEIMDAVKEWTGDHGFALGGTFLLAMTCSAAFWTLVAGSTIGGLVFAVSGQFVVTLAVGTAVSIVLRQDHLFQDDRTFAALLATGLVYSALLLYLGWRKFTKMELRMSSLSQGAQSSESVLWGRIRPRLLVSRRTGRVANLIRKEVRLQKPVFQLAAAYIFCWLVTLVLVLLRPQQDIRYLFDILTCLFAPVASLLAGCISLGEEKALSMTASQLALPFSPWLQWLVKLTVCVSTGAVLSLALPWLLFGATGCLVDLNGSGLTHNNGMVALACVAGLMLVLGFWAISLTANTVRAALVAVCATIILPAVAALGIHCGTLLVGTGAPHGADNTLEVVRDTAVAAVILALAQSLAQFRMSEARRNKLGFYSITLGALVLFVSCWATCFG